MADEDIIQKISLLGAEDIRKELNALGDDGAAALKKLEEAGRGDLAKGVRALMPEVAKLEQGLSDTATTAAKLPGIFSRIGQAFKSITSGSFGKKFSQETDTAAASATSLSQTVRGLGKDLRALGRVTDLSGLGQFGRSINLIGRNIGLIAFPALIAGLGGVANSAAAATSQILDLAAGTEQLPSAFARASSLVIALGGSFEDAGKVIGKFEANISTAMASSQAAAQGIESAREAVESTGQAFDNSIKPIQNLRLEQSQLLTDLGHGKVSSLDYNAAMKKLNDQMDTARQNFNNAADAADKAQRALDRARAVTTPLEDAFRKVGVTLTDTFKKAPIDEQLRRIAPGFAQLGKDVDKTKIAVQLFGEEMGRKFVGALSGGTASLEAFFKEGERVRPALLAQSAVADQFEQSLGKVQNALASVKDAFGLAVAPAFIKFFEDLVNLIVENRESIASFGRALGSVVGPLLEGFLAVVKSLIGAFGLLNPLFKAAATAINFLFGSNLTGAQVFVSVLLGIIAAFSGWIPIILIAATAISALVTQISKIDFGPIFKSASDVFNQMLRGFSVIGQTIVGIFVTANQGVEDAWSGIVTFFTDIWNSILEGATGLWIAVSDAFNAGVKFISDAFTGAFGVVRDAFNSFLAFIQSWVQTGVDFIQGLINKLKELVGAITGVNNANSDANQGTQSAFAEGGHVRGPGTGTSDSILARISNGEFVMKAAAVRNYGTRFMHAINSMSLPRGAPAFSLGGLVDSLSPVRGVPRFAEGGSVTSNPKSAFTLQIGAESFAGLLAPQDTAERMVKFATVRSIRKSGTRPNWFGNGR